MERRKLLATVTGVIVGSNGSLEHVSEVRANTDGAADEPQTEGTNGEETEEANGDEESDAETDDEFEGYSIVGYERLEELLIPSVAENEHSDSTASWMLTDEEDGENLLEEVATNAEWGVESMKAFIDETDFSESILLYANAWGSQTCVLLETVTVAMDDDSVHLVVETERDPEIGCGDAMSQRSELVRVTFTGETPDTGHITYRGQQSDHTEAAIEVGEGW